MFLNRWTRSPGRKSIKPRMAAWFKPRLVPLEERALLSCDVFARGDTLFIRGDDADNAVELLASGASMRVICDNSRAVTFDGINHIVANLGGGDDTFDAVRQDPPDSSIPQAPLSLRLHANDGDDVVNLNWTAGSDDAISVELGSGNDRFAAVLVEPPDPSIPQAPPTLSLSVQGGGGDDITAVFVNPPDPAIPPPDPDIPLSPLSLDFNIDLGSGDDTFDAVLVDPPDPSMPLTLRLNVQGGGGNDVVKIVMTEPPDPSIPPPDPDLPLSPLSLDFNIDLGSGDDTFDAVLVTPPDPSMPLTLRLNVQGGGGNDDITARMGVSPTPFVPVDISLSMDGGAGDDSIVANLGVAGDWWWFRWTPDDEPLTNMWFFAAIDLQGGGGNDDVTARMGVSPTPFVPVDISLNMEGGAGDDKLALEAALMSLPNNGLPVPDDNRIALAVAMNGGGGNDDVAARMGVSPTPFVPVDISFSMDGGAGDDLLDAIFTADPNSQKVAELNVAMFGGGGDDAFRLLWTEAFETIAFVNGGLGFDTGIFSPGVRHVNVEKVD